MVDASDSSQVLSRRKRAREDRAKRVEEALGAYMANDRDLRTALVDLLADAAHLAAVRREPLDRTDLVGIVNEAMWCSASEEDVE